MQRAVRFWSVVPVFLFLAATSQANASAEAQQKSGFVRLDRVTASRAISNGIEIRSGAAIIEITALRDDVLRVRVGPAGQLPEDASWAVLSASRTATVAVSQQSNSSAVGFKTAKLRVSMRRDPLELTVTDLEGHMIAEDLPGRPIEYNGTAFRVFRQLSCRANAHAQHVVAQSGDRHDCGARPDFNSIGGCPGSGDPVQPDEA